MSEHWVRVIKFSGHEPFRGEAASLKEWFRAAGYQDVSVVTVGEALYDRMLEKPLPLGSPHVYEAEHRGAVRSSFRRGKGPQA